MRFVAMALQSLISPVALPYSDCLIAPRNQRGKEGLVCRFELVRAVKREGHH